MNRKIVALLILFILIFNPICHAEVSVKPFIEAMRIEKNSEAYKILDKYRYNGIDIVNSLGQLNLDRYQMQRINENNHIYDIMFPNEKEETPTMDTDSAVTYYTLKNSGSFSYQYATENKFKYLIDNGYFWNLPLGTGRTAYYSNAIDFDENFIIQKRRTYKAQAYFNNIDEIDAKIAEENINEIYDVKMIEIRQTHNTFYSYGNNFLYMDTDKGEYGFYTGRFGSLSNKLYPLHILLKAISEIEIITQPYTFMEPIYKHYANTEKPIEKQEKLSEKLYAEGLVKGYDGDYDLFKCPSRLEALVMLIRALALEEDALSYESQTVFSDVTNGHWGEKYVNYAYDSGLTNGVGDNMFLPDSDITMYDFFTMLLRNFKYDDKYSADYNANIYADKPFILSTAIELKLIDNEDEKSMSNLFTHGDMFQIIYNLLYENDDINKG